MVRKIFGDVDLSRVGRRNVRLAYVVGSPYRFFIGRSLRANLTHAGYRFEIYLRNEVTVADGEPLPSYDWGRDVLHDDLTTDFVIVERTPQLSDEEFAGITKTPGWGGPHFFEESPDYWRAFNVYRNLLLALDTVVQQYHSPGINQSIRAPSAQQFQALVAAGVLILCPRDFALEEEHIEQLLRLFDDPLREGHLSIAFQEDEIRCRFGSAPLTNERIQEIERVFELQERSVHYEFAHQAEVDLQNHDYPAALISAVVALESAHAAYLRTQIEARLPSDMREAEREQLLVQLLRERGVHSLIQVTPYLFLSPETQPSSGAIRHCVEGLEMRNAIMHAKAKKGQPEIRRFDSGKYSNAIRGVLSMYKIFARELERNRDPGTR